MSQSPRSTIWIISELIRTNKTLTEIATEYKMSPQRIGKIYRDCLETGIPIPKRSPGKPTQTKK